MSDRIEFNDGLAYEQYMGVWSRAVGDIFLDWLSPPASIDWLDVGCGNGAFTELIVERCMPRSIAGIDPSDAQLDHARSRAALADARLLNCDAMALPFPDDSFDAAVMPLVIFFVPEPEVGVAEMARVVRPGGIVAAYAWDMPGRGFPYVAMIDELEVLGIEVPRPPSPHASRIEELERLWRSVGLTQVETRSITVQRTFADFEDCWTTVLDGSSFGALLAALPEADRRHIRHRLLMRFDTDAADPLTLTALANAVRGRTT